MPLLSRKRVLIAVLESTVYEAEALTDPANATFVAFDAVIQPNVEMIDRPSQGSFGYHASMPGLQSGTCTFSIEARGDGLGGIPTWASTFLPACGWVASAQVYSPKTLVPAATNVRTITLGVFVDGTLTTLRGCMGTYTITGETGKPARVNFSFMGAYAADTTGTLAKTDATILSPTYGTALPYRFANTSVTVGSMAPCIQSITIDAGNSVTMLPCQKNSDASGYKGGFIGNRRPTITMNPEAELVATDTFVKDLQTPTQRAFSMILTDGTHPMTIAAPKVQPINVQEGNRDGLVTDEVTFLCGKSAAAGDDELTITFA